MPLGEQEQEGCGALDGLVLNGSIDIPLVVTGGKTKQGQMGYVAGCDTVSLLNAFVFSVW